MFNMTQKHLFPIYSCFWRLSASGFKSVHVKSRSILTSVHSSIDSDGFSQDFDEILAGRLASILQTCSNAPALRQGQQVHAQIIVNGISDVGLMGTRILGMYVLCRSFTDAKNLFVQLQWQYTSAWNWMIRGFTMVGRFKDALLFYFKMLSCGIPPDKYTFPYVIKACGSLGAVKFGRLIHETIRLMGYEMDVFVGSSLIKLYAENGSIEDARHLFDRMPEKDCVLWNVMLNGYVKIGEFGKALEVFSKMRSETKPNSVTFACVLSICASEAMIEYGTQLHGLATRFGLDLDSPLANTLVAMYSKCQCLSDARKLFDLMPTTDLVTWNGMISGYVQNGYMTEARDLFCDMLSSGIKPDSITFSSFLPSVSDLAGLKQGKEIQGYIIRNGVRLDVFLKSALIDIYFKCRDVDMAWKIFGHTDNVDVVIFTAMISGFVLNGMNDDALEMFRWLLGAQMQPNSVTLASVLPACAGLATLKLGMELHGYILRNGQEGKCFVGSALSDMYAKCGRLDIAYQVFHSISGKDAVSWNSMITSCSQNGKPEEAISLFRQMGLEGAKYDCVTISAALSACANLPALHYGKEIHGFMMKGSLGSDLFSESALIDMYSKCGDLIIARHVFDSMQVKNEVSWNSIIAAYGTHGHFKDALDLFHKMLDEGIQADHITFLAIMSACGHAGQVDAGFRYFHDMSERYGIMARMEHYACMVDMFGRAGRLEEAFSIINNMPFNTDAGIWGALLGACRVHGNVELAEVASKHLFELDPQNSGYYILLSNVHADAGQWESVLKVRSLMKERGVQKLPGCSWIEVNSVTHMFVAADTSHPKATEIYLLLKMLLLELRREGYVSQPYLLQHPQKFGSYDQVDRRWWGSPAHQISVPVELQCWSYGLPVVICLVHLLLSNHYVKLEAMGKKRKGWNKE
ncbi:pentatricopeptide repeat-containing protein At4g21300 isoform X2 [Macadamia integrifolia]|uniref:pentatricopeptide repeat-containing protein At4g21300 isoform X2 n=1 Tax=Macadamia integrifolia TaxID=60698 RepID=UPI001C52BA31|nr:pentatricopeptide repeat-containing protein At4g21300 isoform X2 [Macadamia integrifolia]